MTKPPAEAIRASIPRASAAFLRLNGLAGEVAVSQAPAFATPCPKPSRKAATRAGRVPRTRNGGTWTEAEFWGRIRSCLRKLSQFWKPAQAALRASRVPFKGQNGQKWAYLCADCQKLHPRKSVHIDHITPCGKLTDFADVGEFIQRLTPENSGAYAIRCLACHQKKTNNERKHGISL